MLKEKRPDILLAIVCCWHRRAATQAIRDTYLPDVVRNLDYRIFYGRGQAPTDLQPDEVILDSDDAYRGLACKVHEIAKWAKKNGYTYVFKIDDDTFIRPERLVRAGYEGKEYIGMMLGATDKYHLQDYARGGTGYWLGPKALDALSRAPMPNPDIPSEYAEDSWVGKTLKAAGIKGEDDSARLRCMEGSGPGRSPRPNGNRAWLKDVPTLGNSYITCCECLGSEMLEVNNEWVKSLSKFNNLMGRIKIT